MSLLSRSVWGELFVVYMGMVVVPTLLTSVGKKHALLCPSMAEGKVWSLVQLVEN